MNKPQTDTRPHSRACGFKYHPHGTDCHPNCPTCHGKAATPNDTDPVVAELEELTNRDIND